MTAPTTIAQPAGAPKTDPGRPEVPELRQDNQPDDLDETRAQYAWNLFQSQDGGYRLRDRSIEKNVRFLAGRQWDVYHHLLGWQDITYWMTEEEKLWRQRPVFNRILPWFILTHARMTENGFVCTFVPGPDRRDGQLAETLDVLYKTKWREIGMMEVWDRTAAWMISAGTGFIGSRIDPDAGDWVPWVGQGNVPVVGEDGQSPILGPDGQPLTQPVPGGVPFGPDGKPRAIIRAGMGFQTTGEPHVTRKGDLAADVYSPLECRGRWGPTPWHLQDTHIARSYLTPEQVYTRWNIECEPDVRGEAASSAGFLERMLFGTGFFGAASAMLGTEFGGSTENKDGYCCVQTSWFAPSERKEGMQQRPGQPGGRLLVTTKKKTLSDGARPFAYKYTSPIRCFDFLRLPGRPGGSTPQETLNSPQHAYNVGWKHELEYRALCTSPQQLYDLRSGLESQDIDNRPGRRYGVNARPGVKAVEWLQPPSLPADMYRIQGQLATEMEYLGSTHNTAPEQVSKDASGELIKELRFNDDRFLGPTMRRAADEMGRLIGDWRVMWPMLFDTETVLKYTGRDNVARTLVLMPDIFEAGNCEVQPDTESMLPEGRGERRARLYKMWQDGAFGDPQSPQALRKLHELGNFPDMGRAMKPGGIDWTTAEQENGELLQGGLPPCLDWYDDEVHLACIEEFMKAPEFRRLPMDAQLRFQTHRLTHQNNLARKQMAQLRAAQAAAAGAPGAPPPPGSAGADGDSAAPSGPAGRPSKAGLEHAAPGIGGGPAAPPKGIPSSPTAATGAPPPAHR